MKPTIVLVHEAFAESASWDAVINPLANAGHPGIAAVNPLRPGRRRRRTVEIPDASRAVAVSQPEATADLILEAASLPATA